MKRWIILLTIVLLITAFIAAQEENDTADLLLSVAGETCPLELVETEAEATPEATAEVGETPRGLPPDWLPDLPTYTLGDDCEHVEPLLIVASNGRLWLALLTEDGNDWLQLDTLEDDPYPPHLYGRPGMRVHVGIVPPDSGSNPATDMGKPHKMRLKAPEF
jgi:hypothetical protein